MKRIILLTVFIGTALGSMAQVRSVRGTSTSNANSVAYSLPRTTLNVSVTATKESVRTGPYARYAQKFLGVMAPLADKDIYTINGATIKYGEEADPVEVYIMENPDKTPLKMLNPTREGFVTVTMDGVNSVPEALGQPLLFAPGVGGSKVLGRRPISHISNDTAFVKVPIDRREVMEKSAESMALAAANAIYTLRQRRFDLVTGEAGENVFGEGLKAAINEINRMENEYLALFLGKQFSEKMVVEYDVIPQKDKNNLVVCRFSETAGLLPVSDLSGRPITMEFVAEKKAQVTPLANKNSKDSRGTVFYRIADVVDCKLVDGKREIAQSRIPIYQYGVTVEVPVTSFK